MILLSHCNKRCQLVILIETRREVKLKEGDMWVYSIAVYGFFMWYLGNFNYFNVRYHLALRYAVFILVIILADGIQWNKISVPARKFCLRAKVAPTTHFLGPDFSRKGQCTSISLICKREETVGKLRKWKWQFIWSWHGASLFINNTWFSQWRHQIVKSK